MKHLMMLFMAYFLTEAINAQESIYDNVKLGNYQVGMMDTIHHFINGIIKNNEVKLESILIKE